MAAETERKAQIQRIASLVERLESCGDPSLRALARELVESIMALHGAGLERILEIAASSGEVGEQLIQQCGCDELVSSLLLLYGLHPDDLRTRVEHALEKSNAFLESHAAHAELMSISNDGAVRVHLHHKPNGGCGSAWGSLRATLETALQDAAPEALAIIVDETGTGVAGFVPLGQLQNGQTLSDSLSGSAVRDG
jgi:Fe-S cluster biogenesis protein NfuA